MKNILFMAVDLGTSFIKAAVYDTEGNCLAEAKEPVQDERPMPGVMIQHGEPIFQSVLNCIKKASTAIGDKANDVEAMGFTGQMAGFMGVDKDWNDITSWSCFIDGRYVPYAEKQMAMYKDKFMSISATNSPLMAPKIEWFANEFPSESKKIAKYLMISGFVIGKLGQCNIEEATIDQSLTTWTGLVDLANLKWSDEICDLVGVDKKYLPKIVKSNNINGYLSPKMAEIVGLRSGIPLVSGVGDKVGGCVGAGILKKGDSIFETGSYGAVSVLVDDMRPNLEHNHYDILAGAVDGLYTHKYIPGSGMTLDWFVDTFMKGMAKKEAFALLEANVPKVAPGCEGLRAVGLLGGNAMPFDGTVRGGFTGFTWSHRLEHFYRALLESYAYDLALTTEAVREKYPEWTSDTMRVIGGGARSEAWLHILADVTGKTFVQIDKDDVALWGASILAGNAIGVFPDMNKVANDHIKEIKRVEPDASKYEMYQEEKEKYRELVKEEVFHS